MPPPPPDFEWMIEEPVIVVYPDGNRVESKIQLGYPMRLGPTTFEPSTPPDNYESNCWVMLGDVVYAGGPIIGVSPFGALQHALQFLASSIADFFERGGRILTVDGEDAVRVVIEPLLQ